MWVRVGADNHGGAGALSWNVEHPGAGGAPKNGWQANRLGQRRNSTFNHDRDVAQFLAPPNSSIYTKTKENEHHQVEIS
jgi:hypothetical protein